jgi:hypothetical protein
MTERFESAHPSLSLPCLDEDIQDLAILIHRSIQIAQFPIDPHEDFIDEPLITARARPLTQPISVRWVESDAPAPNRFVRYIASSLGK